MRRWNGWGDESIQVALPDEANRLLQRFIGDGRPRADATRESLLRCVPASRIAAHPAIRTDRPARLDHCHGQSLPDWVGMRTGHLKRFPDGVAFPASSEQVVELMEFCRKQQIIVIAYGGGTSVAGHLQVPADDRPVLTVSLRRLNRLVSLDPGDRLATFGAGICGTALENSLQANGYTLGHYPQSFECSSLGGWVATRSCGQQSARYGRIEDLYAGGELVSPVGRLEMPPFPASAAGPDLRQLVLGSEGRLGILTRVVVRISPIPEKQPVDAFVFPSWESGVSALKAIATAGISYAMIRLSNPAETRILWSLAGNPGKIEWLKRYLGWRGVPIDRACMCLIGFAGSGRQVRTARSEAIDLIRRSQGLSLGKSPGRQWQRNRFKTPYLRNTLWDSGYAVDTIETAVTWERVTATLQAVEGAIGSSLAEWKEHVHVFSHLSHVYPTGSSIYTTVLFRLAETAEEILAQWHAIKTAASRTVSFCGGTISHQHGVGIDHRDYLENEKGPLGVSLLKQLCRHMDPQGRMNPEKLVP